MYHIYFPHLKTFAHEQTKKSLKDIPFVIHKNGKVIESNSLATEKSILPGMTLTQAHKKTYELATASYNSKLYEETREHFLQILFSFVSRIELENSIGAFFEPERAQRNMDEEEYIKTLHKSLKKYIKTDIRIGYGSNKTVSYIASRLSKKDGFLIVDDSIAQEFIAMLPLSLLPGLGKRTAMMLSGFGMYTVGQFAMQPIQQAISLFGKSGVELRDRAMALDNRPLLPTYKPNLLTTSSNIEVNNQLQPIFHSLLASLKEKMISQKIQPGSISISIVTEEGHIISSHKKNTRGTYINFTRMALHAFNEIVVMKKHIKKLSLSCHSNTSKKTLQKNKELKDKSHNRMSANSKGFFPTASFSSV